MCLIIHRERDFPEITKDFFADVWQKNNDGWGISWKTNKGTKARKGMTFSSFWNLYRTLERNNIECAIHFRMQTHGAINTEMCHPFKVLDDDYGGIWMMHNGIIDYPLEVAEDKSDTWAFASQLIIPMLQQAKDPYELIRTDAFRFLVEKWAGGSNRLLFVDYQGITRYNTDLWTETNFGVTVSNSYAHSYTRFQNAYKKPYWEQEWDDWCYPKQPTNVLLPFKKEEEIMQEEEEISDDIDIEELIEHFQAYPEDIENYIWTRPGEVASLIKYLLFMEA